MKLYISKFFADISRKPKKAVIIIALFFAGCATFYQSNMIYQQNLQSGNYENALKVLESNKKEAKGKNRFLYFLQMGYTQNLLGKWEESNDSFEEAYLFTEDYRKTAASTALSLLTNPESVPYTGEDFEKVMIHYYKAINYLMLKNYENAQVECRRINIGLNDLNDKYSKHKNKYSRDAFAWNIMGIIFEATGDANNAFISYRNAYETYDEDYSKFFGMGAPLQLKKDLLRMAFRNGFIAELAQYEEIFGIKYEPEQNKEAELVFFWHNGLGPIKDQWDVTFALVRGGNGMVNFVSDDLGMSFPFFLSDNDRKTRGLEDLKVVRVAFPKYVERIPFFSRAELTVSDKTFELEEAENINAIAFKCLEDRMFREMATSLLRLAIKQASEEAIRKKSDGLGALLSIANAITEKADTRNWQTLPHSISYVRVPLKEGENNIALTCYSAGGTKTVNFTALASKGETVFNSYHTLESGLPGQFPR